MMKRMGLSFLPITALVDSMFRAFSKHSTSETKELYGEMIDLRGFLVSLCVIFKGTVDEKVKSKEWSEVFRG